MKNISSSRVRIRWQTLLLFQILASISLHPLTHFIKHGVYELSPRNERTCSIDKSLLFEKKKRNEKKRKMRGRVKLDAENVRCLCSQ